MTALNEHQEEEVLDGQIVDEPVLTVVPYTGEALTLAAMTDSQIAEVLDAARVWERERLAGFKRDLQEEVLRRMDARAAAAEDGAYTIHCEGGIKLQGDSPDRTDYDLDELRRGLQGLVDAGLLPATQCEHCGHVESPVDKVIVPERMKVAKRKLDQLAKLGGVVKDTIASCKQPVTRPRGVRVVR